MIETKNGISLISLLFCKFLNSNFEFVSDFGFRASDLFMAMQDLGNAPRLGLVSSHQVASRSALSVQCPVQGCQGYLKLVVAGLTRG